MIDRKTARALILTLIFEYAGVFAWDDGSSERLQEVELRSVSQSELAELPARVVVELEIAARQMMRIEG